MNTQLRTLALLIAIAIGGTSQATTYTVSVANFQFTPSSVTVQVGDTVTWMWSNGTHTTTSTSVPAGAATWDSPITNSATTFSYKITKAGTYSYVCTPHAPNMAGTITATGSTAVSNVAAGSIGLFPNPAATMLQISLRNATGSAAVSIVDAMGRIALQQTVDASKTASVSIANLAAGTYVVRAELGGTVLTETFVVAR